MDKSTDGPTGAKFGDLKKEERYKRLERDLRLEFTKHMERIKADFNQDHCTSPTWPSLSSINPDNLDTSSANVSPSLQVSRVESEVIASSSNLRKVFPMPKHCEQVPMTTSSVKQFSVKHYDKDCAIMPPPSTTNFLSKRKGRFSSLNSKQNEHNNTHDSETKISSAASCSSYHEEEFNTSHGSKNSRRFYRWRVLLNNEGQLIIKGTLDCGKIARSKPVIDRLSSTTVQSIYKHIYILCGPIVDEREELPDYIRGKFHNGFPDDWENVHQLWTSFVADGCKPTFRWPTPITDSDDDLYSEITDFTYFKSKSTEYREQHSKIVTNNDSSMGYHSKTQSNSNFNFENSKEDQHNSHSKPDSCNKSKEDSGHASDLRDSNTCNTDHGIRNVAPNSHNTSGSCSNSNLRNASFLSEIIKEDKLRIIMSNLGDENCPPQYLDKLIELSDCLKYILSYTTNNDEIDFEKQHSSCSKSQIHECEKCNNNTVSLVKTSQDHLTKLHNAKTSKTDNVRENLPVVHDRSKNSPIIENLKQLDSHGPTTDDSSDSDGYMGVPHIPANRLILSKSQRFPKYRDRRNQSREKYQKDVKKDSEVESQMVPVVNSKVQIYDDSSVSITEDEFEKRKQETKDHQLNEPFLKPMKVSNENSNTRIRIEESSKVTKTNSFNEKENDNVNITNHKSILPSPSSKKTENIMDKKTPFIKSCEPVHFHLKLQQAKNQKSIPPDITILHEEVSNQDKNHSSNNNNNQNYYTSKIEEKLQKETLKPSFLTYDSEDYFNDKEASMQIELPLSLSSKNIRKNKSNIPEQSEQFANDVVAKQENQKKIDADQKTPSGAKKSTANRERPESEPFGSKNNPQLLTSWAPCMEFDKANNKLSLKFEGKLLNERGHVLHRKFVTDPIFQRHSSKLIETDKHEFFTLIGNLCDVKHVVPKELVKQCTTGCPSKIKEFCETWKKSSSVLEKGSSVKPDNLQNASIKYFDVPTSSRGRRCVPSLNFWTGERLVKKDSDVVYTPGNMQENVLTSTVDNLKKTLPLSEQRPQRSKRNLNANVKGSLSSSKPSKGAENSSDTDEKHSPLKKPLVQQLIHLSSEQSSDSDEPKKYRKVRGEGQAYRVKTKLEKLRTCYNTRQRGKRKNVENHQKIQETTETKKVQSSIPLSQRLLPVYRWSYEKEQTYPEVLSDDELSIKK